MVPDGRQRLDVAAAIAANEERPDAGSPRSLEDHVLGVADVQRLAGLALSGVESGREDGGIGLPRPGRG